MTSAYLDGRRDDLTGLAGRQAAVIVDQADDAENTSAESEAAASTYDLRLMVEAKGIACTCVCGPRTEQWTIPKSVIRRPHKAIGIGAFFEQLGKKGTRPFS